MAPSLSLYGWKAALPKAEREKALERAAKDLGWLSVSRKFNLLGNSKDDTTRLAAIEDRKYSADKYTAEKEAIKLAKKGARSEGNVSCIMIRASNVASGQCSWRVLERYTYGTLKSDESMKLLDFFSPTVTDIRI